MARDIEDEIVQYMQAEAVGGHFEHSNREIKAGIGSGFSTGGTQVALGRLVEKKVLASRKKGTATLYYLVEIREFCRQAWA